MKNKDATRLREAWVPQARGEVLEIGIGSGLNLPFYSSEVQRVIGVEPSVALQEMARRKGAGGHTKVDFLSRSAEEPLPLPDQSIDTIVMTWTLCSIPNAPKALSQMKRVLKPDGRLPLYRAWPCSGPARRRLAGPTYAGLEADWGRLPPQSQDRRTYRGGRIRNR